MRNTQTSGQGVLHFLKAAGPAAQDDGITLCLYFPWYCPNHLHVVSEQQDGTLSKERSPGGLGSSIILWHFVVHWHITAWTHLGGVVPQGRSLRSISLETYSVKCPRWGLSIKAPLELSPGLLAGGPTPSWYNLCNCVDWHMLLCHLAYGREVTL